MINAMIFDLDGTLVKTERLKALSYAQAAVHLRPKEINEDEVIAAFKDVVGLPRREVATTLLDRFDLAEKASLQMPEFGVNTPWQAFVQLRLHYYEAMISDPLVIQDNQWPHTMALLNQARKADCKIGLATMSYCAQAQRVLGILGHSNTFDFVATRDDVEKGKPDPEIYLLVSEELDVPPDECLVIEDSPSGVKAGLEAGMKVVAVTTPFTRTRLYESNLLPEKLIVNDPERLISVVEEIFSNQ